MCDEDNVPKFCCLRSIYKNSNFRQDVKNSDKSYGFTIKGKSDRVFIFESPIDAISHATLRKINNIDYKKDTRISMGGLNAKPLVRFLKANKNVKELILCFDIVD